MIMRHRGLLQLAFCLSVVSVAGCTTIEDLVYSKTQVDYKKGYDFGHIETLAIAPCGYSGFRPALLTDEQRELVNVALVQALQKRGMEVIDSLDDADAVVDWHVVTEEKSAVRSYNAQSYYQCWRCGPAISGKSVTTYTLGTFIVDIIDPELSKSVWRGVMKGSLADVSEIAMEPENLNMAADEIFSRFPPKVLIPGIY
jgi:hypothetical protein